MDYEFASRVGLHGTVVFALPVVFASLEMFVLHWTSAYRLIADPIHVSVT